MEESGSNQQPINVWVAAGFSGAGDPSAVTDAFTVVTRTIITEGGTVHLWTDPTFASLARYIALEHGAEERVVIHGDKNEATVPTFDATQPDTSFYIGGGDSVTAIYQAAKALPNHDAFCLAATGGDSRRLASFSTAAALPEEIVEVAKMAAIPYSAATLMSWTLDRTLGREPRVDLGGLRRSPGRGVG